MEKYYVERLDVPKRHKTSKPIKPIRKKLVVVGDSCSGKRTLLGMVIENYLVNTEVDGQPVEMAVWWTGTTDDYDRIRPLVYAYSDVILICFAVDDPESFENVAKKWFPEVLYYYKRVPIILVGCKKDLRRDLKTNGESNRRIGFEEAETVARELGAIQYLECSSIENDGVHEVLQSATRAALLHNTSIKTTCTII